MNKLKTCLLFYCLVMGALTVQAQANIAPQATASTSFVSSWETIVALNDNFTPANSNDKSHGAYGNWNNPNSLQWVQYDWAQTYSVSSIQVYWFNDGEACLPLPPLMRSIGMVRPGSTWAMYPWQPMPLIP
ncbi:hypothetical protein [Paraflavitalea speifideaquila]|uniref:hypothetical protein n=1 Tax=Paraflavitalea speifideaquila TaxID=3076558 RepID=UPI0028F03D55|nr:hypothetical protein [Paraflavitalea speifideiaquila]